MKQNQQLLRRYVGRRLAEYYAQPADRVVGTSTGVDSSNLSSLLGQWHWRRLFKKLYEEREGHWLTPVELFRPHYSRVLADFCASTVTNGTTKLEIYELGGGRGTNASLILSYMQEKQPELYTALTSYTLVDSSPTLHRLQKDALAYGDHADKVRFELKDLVDVAEKKVTLLPKSNVHTVVIGMEVLDNLPHDKVRAASRKKLEQAEVRSTAGGDEEVFVPLTDPLLAKVTKAVPSYVNIYPSWVPSVACGVLHHIVNQRPNNLGLVFADFDWLPAPDLNLDASLKDDRLSAWSEGEPIVTDMEGVDHECYLRAPPHCDILFPTDFDKLASFVRRTSQQKADLCVQVQKQSEFLEFYGPEHVKTTRSWLSGHTPLLHDFANCSVLTATTNPRML